MNISTKQKQKIRSILYTWRWPRDIIFSYLNIGYWDKSWRLFGTPLIHRKKNSIITIGKNWTAVSDARHNSLGVFQRVTIKTVLPGAKLIIGDNVGMSGVSISCFTEVSIGNNTLLGSGSVITDNDAHSVVPEFRNSLNHILRAPVKIQENVFIGARAMILKGVTIGHGAVVGAGSVVTKDVPALAIVAGNPAKIVGNVRDEKFSLGKILPTS